MGDMPRLATDSTTANRCTDINLERLAIFHRFSFSYSLCIFGTEKSQTAVFFMYSSCLSVREKGRCPPGRAGGREAAPPGGRG